MAEPRPNRSGVTPFRFAMLGAQLVGFTVLGVVIDWLARSLPWATVILTILGLVATFVQLALAVRVRPPDPPPPG